MYKYIAIIIVFISSITIAELDGYYRGVSKANDNCQLALDEALKQALKEQERISDNTDVYIANVESAKTKTKIIYKYIREHNTESKLCSDDGYISTSKLELLKGFKQ